MAEPKGHQQQEAGGPLQFHLCLMVTECMFTSLKVCNLRLMFRGLTVLGTSEFRIESPDTYTVDGNSLGFRPPDLVLQILPMDQGVAWLPPGGLRTSVPSSGLGGRDVCLPQACQGAVALPCQASGVLSILLFPWLASAVLEKLKEPEAAQIWNQK